jgi:hypothetical protein
LPTRFSHLLQWLARHIAEHCDIWTLLSLDLSCGSRMPYEKRC